MIFRILMSLALAAGGVLTFFFLWGLADGSLYGDAGFSLLFVALAWGLIAASFALHRRKVPIVPHLVLLPLVFPAVMYGLIIVIFMLSGESWR